MPAKTPEVEGSDFAVLARMSTRLSGRHTNVAAIERGATGLLGLAMIAKFLRSSWPWPLALVYRALRGYCPVYHRVGLGQVAESHIPAASTTSAGATPARSPSAGALLVERGVTVQRLPRDVYHFWRDFENLPKFMSALETVRIRPNGVSEWTVRGPAGTRVQLEAAVTADVRDTLIAWAARNGSEIRHEGSVSFVPAPGARGTEVRVRLRYEPVWAKLGALMGEDPAQRVVTDLERLKQILEAGEIPTGARRQS